MGKLGINSAVVVVIWRQQGTLKSLLSKQQSFITCFLCNVLVYLNF